MNGKTLLIFALLFCFLGSISLWGEEVSISDIYFEDNFLLLSVQTSITDILDIHGFIEDGIDLEVSYEIFVFRKMSFLVPDELVTNILIYRQVTKDFINDGYELVETVANTEKVYWYRDVIPLYQKISGIKDFPVIMGTDLSATSVYYAQIQVKYISLKLYPPLSIIYNILGKWNYTSKKIKSRTFSANGLLLE